MKELTYQEFIDLAMKHYNRGGDEYVECWDESYFQEFTDAFGAITETKARKLFNWSYSIQRDRSSY